jgi:hypothetical protein
MQHPGFLILLSAALALAILPSGCSDKVSKSSHKEDTPYTRKVSSSIREVVERMKSDGQASDSAQEAVDLGQLYSTAIVKVDEEGRIQCYIALDPFERKTIDSLRTFSIVIEREEATLALLQAWVPFDRVQPLSRLSCVRRIRPPDYPAPR